MPGEPKEIANGDVIAEEEEAVDNGTNGEANVITQSQVEPEEREERHEAKDTCPTIVVVEPEEDREKLKQPDEATAESEARVELENQERESGVSCAEGKVESSSDSEKGQENAVQDEELDRGEKPAEKADKEEEVEPRVITESQESGDEMMLVPNSTLASMMEEGEVNPAEEVKESVEQVPEKDDIQPKEETANKKEEEAREEVAAKEELAAKEEVVTKVEVAAKEDVAAKMKDEVKSVGAQMEKRVQAEMEALVSDNLDGDKNSLTEGQTSHGDEKLLGKNNLCIQVKNAGWDPAIKQRIQTTPNGWQLLSV